MAAKVICMASAKGGSGKTVLTATFSVFLANLGKKVLMIDTDASTNGLTLMFFKETRMRAEYAASQRRTPYGMFEGSPTDPKEIVPTPLGPDLIPATFGFKNTEEVPVKAFEEKLLQVVNAAREMYDFIFLDAQAGSDRIAYLAMSQDVSDRVVLVSEYDPLSAAGIERLKGLFREDLTYVRTWILLNKMLPDFVKSFSDFMEVAKYASPIPWDSDVVRAYSRRKLALDTENGNEFTLAIVQSLKSIFAEELEEEINAWLAARGAALREPIETQYRDLEKQLEGLLMERSLSRVHVAKRRTARTIYMFALGAAVATVPLLIKIVDSKMRLEQFDLMSTRWILLFLTLCTGSTVIVTYLLDRPQKDSITNEVEQVRIDRQIKVLQNRLEKVEALKGASIEALLLSRGRID